jgi:hypothetical protein
MVISHAPDAPEEPPPAQIKCPACDHWEDEYDFDRQRVHLLANHPNLVRDRLAEHHRYDGWEQD